MKKNNLKELLRVILAVSIIIVGVTHFTSGDQYVRIVPPQLPYPLGLVYLSGFYEILGGIGLLVPPVSQATAWGLIALFIAVYPANINMAVNHIPIDNVPNSPWLQAIRLPFQAVFIAWAWWYTQPSDFDKQASIIPKSLIPEKLLRLE
ncbi:DoxX family protein [Brasilonema sp. CT11]|nr:DoxX family protein [Brasilonema sp. CT11]